MLQSDKNHYLQIHEKFCGGYPSTPVHDPESNQSEGVQEFRVRCYNEVLTIKEFCRSLKDWVGSETYSYGACDGKHLSFALLILPLSVKLGVDRTGFVERRCELILN